MDIQKKIVCHKTGIVMQFSFWNGNAGLLWLCWIRVTETIMEENHFTETLQFALIAEVVNDKTQFGKAKLVDRN